MKTLIVFLFSTMTSICLAAEGLGYAHHPEPTEPVYMSSSIYDSIKAQFPKQPDLKSEAQKKDEKELFALQKSRTDADCAQANKEVYATLKNMYGAPKGILKDADIEKLSGFFEQIRNDGNYFVQRLKKDFPRQRPYLYLKGLNPCIPKETSQAYPSGHAALSRLFALVLSEIYPQDKEKFEKIAAEVGMHRVLAGVHHPTDIESGRKLADLLFAEIKKSDKYQAEIKKLK